MRLRGLSADDIFISYSRKDAATYALSLADSLMRDGFSCYLDRLGSAADTKLPPSLLKKLKSCAMLVVVGTRGARESEAVAREVSEYARANGTSRIVPIDCEGDLQGARWQPQIAGVAAEYETAEALSEGNPSPSVVKRIEKAFSYTRSKQRLRRYSISAAVLLGLSVVAGVASFAYARAQLAQARAAKEEARSQRLIADGERKAAVKARQESDVQARLARVAEDERLKAESGAEVATRKATAAEARATDALSQQSAAEARERVATANAERQEKIGASARIESQAARQFADQFDLGLVLSAEGLNVYDTYEARNGLLSVLQQKPRLLAHLALDLKRPEGNLFRERNLDAIFSEDEKTLATRNMSGVTLWNVATAEKLFSIDIDGFKVFFDFALSPDGRLLALGFRERLVIWDVAARRQLREVKLPDNTPAVDLTFDPTGKRLAFSHSERTVHLLEIQSSDDPVELPDKTGPPANNISTSLMALAFSPDGKVLAAAGTNVMTWDVETRLARPGWPPVSPPGYPYHQFAAYSPDGKVLVTADAYRRKMVLWDAATGKKLRDVNLGTRLASLAFSRKGNLLAVGSEDGTIRLWDFGKMAEVERLSAGRARVVHRVAFTKDDRKLISVGEEVLVWDMSDTQQLGPVFGVHHGGIEDVAFSPDGRYVVSCDTAGDPVTLQDARTGQLLGHPFREALNGATRFSFSGDGKLLAMVTGSEGHSFVQTWDVEGRRLVSTPFEATRSLVGQMAMSPDGRMIVVGPPGYTFIDAASGRELHPIKYLPGTEHVTAFLFSPDGGLLAVGTSEGNIILVDTGTFEEVGRMSARQTDGYDAVANLAFSPDGKTLASDEADNIIVLWDVASRTRLRELVHFGGDVYLSAVAFSPDGRMLATAGMLARNSAQKEYPIFLWDMESYQPLGQPLRGHSAEISRLAFSPHCDDCAGGMRLVSGSHDGTLRMWDVSVTSWQRRACGMTDRRLTAGEHSFYIKYPAHSQACAGRLSFAALNAPTAATGNRPGVPVRGRVGFAFAENSVGLKMSALVWDNLEPKGELLPGSRLVEDLGADEAKKAALFKAIREKFGVEISAEDAKMIENFRDLIGYVERRVKSTESLF